MNKMTTQRKLEKKLREIQILKQKENLSADELEKIQKEGQYKKSLKQFGKILELLPDDVQVYILEFVDRNTRVNYLRTIYTPEYVKKRLSALKNNKLTIKRLYSCVKYIKNLFTNNWSNYKHRYGALGRYENNEIYADLLFAFHNYDASDGINYYLKKPPKHNRNLYFDSLISIITSGIKQYSKMYKQTKNPKVIEENETNLLKLFVRISSL